MAKSEHLTCPYGECKKGFERPVMLTDYSKMPRETYYACPHCLTKVDIVAKDRNISTVSLGTSEKILEKPPSECHFKFGYLNDLTSNASIPDACLTCSELLHCIVKKEASR